MIASGDRDTAGTERDTFERTRKIYGENTVNENIRNEIFHEKKNLG